ncbi:carboxypeptidase-like regulatory domain-containing protein [Hymenobacter cavernae]|uniref:Carboxypeptidase-like regulatory domain-containing protein n=1 Tax=Hymenobacter cavernae TaxID=2044852 RepID=A0ABQ1THS7_9BACT|nr:carboxypeptidase-like regulatory domain-containing protein [Hymenobacter cavernae]GGE94365.1 hypothetical protein GCM10011383_01350 [Hymenobacter cavernae]
MLIHILRKYLLTLYCLAIYGVAFSQGTLGGQVRDSLTHEPLAYASVFLANTTRGVSTDANGRFVLTDVPTGHYDFIISYLGYKLYRQTITVANSPLVINAFLAKATNQLGEVVVHPNPNRAADYRHFEQLFLGATSFSRQCRIRNPEAIFVDNDPDKKLLTASSPTFVEIDNQALGYCIRYYGLRFQLDLQGQVFSFYGYPIFEQLATTSASKRRRWEANRRKAYLGSLPHFLKSVYDNRLTEEGYVVQKVQHIQNPKWQRADSLLRVQRAALQQQHRGFPDDSVRQWQQVSPRLSLLYRRPLPPDSVRGTQPNSEKVWLRFQNFIQVTYLRERPDRAYLDAILRQSSGASIAIAGAQPEVSLVSLLDKDAEIERNGHLINPLAILSEGYWAFEKVGELLPFDYRLPATE